MRYFRLEYTDPDSGAKVSNVHAISGDASAFLEHARENAEKVVELEEKEVPESGFTC